MIPPPGATQTLQGDVREQSPIKNGDVGKQTLSPERTRW